MNTNSARRAAGPTLAMRANAEFLADLPHFAFNARDGNMDRLYPPGGHLVCISIEDWPDEIVAGMRVIVDNWRGGRFEVLCREIEESNGWLYLVPRSHNPSVTERLRWRASGEPPEQEAGPDPSETSARPDGPEVVAVVVAYSLTEHYEDTKGEAAGARGGAS